MEGGGRKRESEGDMMTGKGTGDAVLLVLKNYEVAIGQECERLLEAGKAKEMCCILESTKRTKALPTP